MKIITRFFLICCVYLYSFQTAAQSVVDRIIKEQKNNDDVVRHESQQTKRDVYSSIDAKEVNDILFPVEKPCFRIDRLIINNDFLHNREIKKIKKSTVGRCLGEQGVAKLAQAIQDSIINAGYITTRVEIPDQDLSSHVLRLAILPGKIENIVIENHDIIAWTLPFGKEAVLNIRDIEQGLENLQKIPDVDVKITLEPGSRVGYSTVMIYTSRKKNWNVRASVSNWGDKSTGKVLAGTSGYLYNLANVNDIFYLSASRSLTGKYQSISGYYSFPVGYWDYAFFYSQSVSHQMINSDGLDLDYSGENQYFSVKSSRTLYRDRDKKVTAIIEFLKRKSDYQVDDIKLALQKRDLSNVRFGVNYKQNYPAAMLNGTLAYQRFLIWPGGRLTSDMKSGDVSSTSQLLNLDINYIKLMQYGHFPVWYDVNLGVQYAPEPLILQDQFTLGSRWSVRGFENSPGLEGNNGFYLQNTVGFNTGIKEAECYFGMDYGVVSTSQFSQKNQAKTLIGAITGLKGRVNALAYDISLSAPLVYPSALTTDRLVINVNFFYQL